jgi:serine/threonine-protein kinase
MNEPGSGGTGPLARLSLTLTVMAGPSQGHVFTCAGAGAFLVGRSGVAHWSLPDPYLSRSHFLLEVNPPRYRLLDLGGSNPTQVNNQPVSPDAGRDLHDGDVIRAGQTQLRVSLSARGSAAGAGDEAETLVLPAAGQVCPPTPTTSWSSSGTPPPSPTDPQEPSYETVAPSGNSLRPGDLCPLVAGYRIEKELGKGGMGVVYLATRLRDGARVALKTIIPAVRVPDSQVKRFLRETNILRQLDHENIVRFYEGGECEGILYLTMAYVEGTDAARMLKEQKGPLSVSTAVRMIYQLLKALEYAHALGFVHRDIKPANLLVGDDGRKRTVKLADFGLARVYQESEMSGSGVTLKGEIGGTVAFMPPEQIHNFRQVKPSADQYAAAATLYTLLTGCHTYEFEIINGKRNLEKDLEKIVKEAPVPIEERRPDLPPELVSAIHRALAKNPENRFPGAAAFRAALKAFV